MIEHLESCAELSRVMHELNQEGRVTHARVLKTTLDLELKSIWGEKDDERRFDHKEAKSDVR